MLSDVLDQAVLLNRQNPTDDGPSRNSNTRSNTRSRHPIGNRVMASNEGAGAAEAAVCPVDHKSREAWMEQARQAAAASSSSSSSSSTPALPAFHPPVSTDSGNGGAQQEACPVDHKARDVWMQQARAANAGGAASEPPAQSPSTTTTTTTTAPSSSSSWTSSVLSYLPFKSSSSTAAASTPAAPITGGLSTDREISTIPRTTMPSPSEMAAAAAPANREQETGADEASGNWIYPSQRMFFDAMKRKGHDPRSNDMQTIVPIHNAVNERAWADIKRWEEPWTRGTR